MQFQRVNRTDAEKVFIVVKNVSGATATTGRGMRYVGGAAAEIVSTDGVQAVLLDASGNMPLFCGIAAQDIADNGYGRVQAWGYVNSVAYSAEADKTIGVTGLSRAVLIKGALAGSFTSTGGEGTNTSANYKFVLALTTVNISGGLPYGSGFVRAL